jgi:hypothetical protein
MGFMLYRSHSLVPFDFLTFDQFLGAEIHPLDFERGLFLVIKVNIQKQTVVRLYDDRIGTTKWEKRLDFESAILLGFSCDYVAVVWQHDSTLLEIYSNDTGQTLVSFPSTTR